MTPIAGLYVVTAAEMRAAEAAEIVRGASIESLMARAGEEIAAVVLRLAAGSPVLVLCGPGNNGGDGYVAATILRKAGLAVRIAASDAPRSDAARYACTRWAGPVSSLEDAVPAPILLDALFGTGLSRSLDSTPSQHLHRLRAAASLAIAVDLPSGLATDDGVLLGDVPIFDLTLALAAVKPAHLLQPGAARCRPPFRVLDIGVPIMSTVQVLDRPCVLAPGPEAHKYTRGMVAIVGGAMRGAAELAAVAAIRAGAGYALLLADGDGAPHAVVRRRFMTDALDDKRIGALLIGPGLGRDDAAHEKLDVAIASAAPLVVDGDALHLLDEARFARLRDRAASAILTPHAGEFETMFGRGEGSKIDRARAAAKASGATIVFKGADTVIAAPDGIVRVAEASNPWLSTAGTGDVLAGAVAAMLAAGLEPLDAAAAGVWLHADAARRLGAAFIADDLAAALTAARAGL